MDATIRAKDVEIAKLQKELQEMKQANTGYVLILHHSKDVESHRYTLAEYPVHVPLPLEELQKHVGGFIEDLTGQLLFRDECVKQNVAMYGNEEAVPLKLPESRWSSGEGCDVMFPYVFLRGDLIFVGTSPTGYEMPLTKKQVNFIKYQGFGEYFGSDPDISDSDTEF